MEIQNSKDYAKVYVARNFIEKGVCEYADERVYLSAETLNKVAHSLKGRPVIIDHVRGITPENMQKYAVGYVTQAICSMDGQTALDCEFVVFDDEGKRVLADGYSVSCAYTPKAFGPGGTWHNVPYDREITDLEFTHLALVQNPRYEDAKVYENAKDKDGQDGRWITIKGTHVFIKDGQSVEDAMKETFKSSPTEKDKAHKKQVKIDDLKSQEQEILKQYWEATEGSAKRDELQYKLDAIKDERLRLEEEGEKYYRQKEDEDLIGKHDDIQKQKEELLKKLKATDDVKEGDKILAQMDELNKQQDALGQKRMDIAKEAYTKEKGLKGKYAKEDADFDEEQALKDIKEARSFGYETIDDVAEFLGLDPDEVMGLTGESYSDEDFQFKTSSEYKSKKHPDGIVLDLVGKEELIKGFKEASKGQTISKELEDKLSKEMQKYSNLPGWSDMFEQMWDEIDDYRDQWKEQSSKGDELVTVQKADPAAVKKEKEAKDRWDKTMREYGELSGKYAKEDVDFDIDQMKKDIKTVQSKGYESVEDIAEFLGLDEDEVRETLIGNGDSDWQKSKYGNDWQLDQGNQTAKVSAKKDDGYTAKLWDSSTGKISEQKSFETKEDAMQWAEGKLKDKKQSSFDEEGFKKFVEANKGKKDNRSFEGYSQDILKRAKVSGAEGFQSSKDGYSIKFTIPEQTFREREKALGKMFDKDGKVEKYDFGGSINGRTTITVRYKKEEKHNNKEERMNIEEFFNKMGEMIEEKLNACKGKMNEDDDEDEDDDDKFEMDGEVYSKKELVNAFKEKKNAEEEEKEEEEEEKQNGKDDEYFNKMEELLNSNKQESDKIEVYSQQKGIELGRQIYGK